MTRKAFLALLCAIPAAAVAAFKRKTAPTAGLCSFRSRFTAALDPAFGKDGYVVLYKWDALKPRYVFYDGNKVEPT